MILDMTAQPLHVSIHAPARGATDNIAARILYFSFNSRAREGRDSLVRSVLNGCCSFNSRAREGRDAQCAAPSDRERQVSIHAPARGATDDVVLPFHRS